jgi:hypothetical protein
VQEQCAPWDTYRPYTEERYGRKNNRIRVVPSSQSIIRAVPSVVTGSVTSHRPIAPSSQMTQTPSSLRSSSGNIPRSAAINCSASSAVPTAPCANEVNSFSILDEEISMPSVLALQPLRNAAGPAIPVVRASQPVRASSENPMLFDAALQNNVQRLTFDDFPTLQPGRNLQQGSTLSSASVNAGAERVSLAAEEAETVAHQFDVDDEFTQDVERSIAQHVRRANGTNSQPLGIAIIGSYPSPAGALPDDPFGSPTRPLQAYPVLSGEAIQPVDEVATRTFHSTMNQMAPKPSQKSKAGGSKTYPFGDRLERPSPSSIRQEAPKVPAIDPIPRFREDMNASFTELLKGLRGFQGALNIQADFGRILLKVAAKNITGTDSEQSMPPHAALQVLGPPYPAPTVFTKVVTVLPAEISYLVETKDYDGGLLWKQEPTTFEIMYEFLCVDTRTQPCRPFTIEIDGERLTCQAKTRVDFGAINVHGVKRHWDFCISATGVHTEVDLDPAYRDLAKAVRDSLHIP